MSFKKNRIHNGLLFEKAPGNILVGVLLTGHRAVDVLKELVEAELAHALQRVADGGGGPALEQSSGT